MKSQQGSLQLKSELETLGAEIQKRRQPGSIIEDIIDCNDRTDEVTLHWRGRYGKKIWTLLKARAEKMMLEHMPTSEMHQSAKYIVTHFPELTHYLNDPWVHPTNNQVERILRSERTMLNNSKFRQSKKDVSPSTFSAPCSCVAQARKFHFSIT